MAQISSQSSFFISTSTFSFEGLPNHDEFLLMILYFRLLRPINTAYMLKYLS
jgi:hypothetical protein